MEGQAGQRPLPRKGFPLRSPMTLDWQVSNGLRLEKNPTIPPQLAQPILPLQASDAKPPLTSVVAACGGRGWECTIYLVLPRLDGPT